MTPQQTAKIYKIMGDETRLSLIRRLHVLGGETAGNDLIQECGGALSLSQPTLSHHLSKLVAVTIFTERKVGTEKRYCLNTELLNAAGINIDKL